MISPTSQDSSILPAELRLMVFEAAFADVDEEELKEAFLLLQVCKDVRREAMPIFLARLDEIKKQAETCSTYHLKMIEGKPFKGAVRVIIQGKLNSALKKIAKCREIMGEA